MLEQSAIIKAIQSQLPDAKLVYLFGSQADGSATDTSDIDIAVMLDKKMDNIERWHHQEALAITFDKDVDLIDLLSASTVLQNQIIENGICLLGDENTQQAFEMQIMSMYQRLNEERADILKAYTK